MSNIIYKEIIMNTHIYKGACGKSYVMEALMRDKQNQICGIIYENNNYPSFYLMFILLILLFIQ